MTDGTMTCAEVNDRMADFLERELDDATRASMEAHALDCADCRSLIADLRGLRIRAAALPELVPQRDLWAGIASRIETPVVEIMPGGATRDTRHATRDNGMRSWRSPIWTGLAAAGLVAVTATVTHQLTKRDVIVKTIPLQALATPPVAVVKDTTLPARKGAAVLASNKLSPDQTYDQEIARLRAIIERRRGELDTSTVAVIEHNLAVIDGAIEQCRQALRKDPASRFLIESLNDALDTKVRLLQTAATLPSRM